MPQYPQKIKLSSDAQKPNLSLYRKGPRLVRRIARLSKRYSRCKHLNENPSAVIAEATLALFLILGGMASILFFINVIDFDAGRVEFMAYEYRPIRVEFVVFSALAAAVLIASLVLGLAALLRGATIIWRYLLPLRDFEKYRSCTDQRAEDLRKKAIAANVSVDEFDDLLDKFLLEIDGKPIPDSPPDDA